MSFHVIVPCVSNIRTFFFTPPYRDYNIMQARHILRHKKSRLRKSGTRIIRKSILPRLPPRPDVGCQSFVQPSHRVFGFHGFIDSLGNCRLACHSVHPFLTCFIDLSQMCAEHSG